MFGWGFGNIGNLGGGGGPGFFGMGTTVCNLYFEGKIFLRIMVNLNKSIIVSPLLSLVVMILTRETK